MQRARRRWARLALVLALLCTVLGVSSAPAQASDNPCGQTWPTSGSVTTYKSDSTNYYSVTFRFTLTSAQLTALRCTGAYLELDFRIHNFDVPYVWPWAWDGYTVAGTNLPGGIHDVAYGDAIGEPTPAVTRIRTIQLQAGVSYYANLTWYADTMPGWTPYVEFWWTPSHWSNMSDPGEASYCAGASFGNNTYPEGDSRNPNEAWCIFPVQPVSDTVVLLLGSHTFAGGFPAGQVPLMTGQFWYTFGPITPTGATLGDYTNDHRADPAVWRPSDGIWRTYNTGLPFTQWGWTGDIPVPADYDGDGKTDLGTWRPSTGVWNIHFSSGRPDVINYQWGWSEDIPVPADYDGDGMADMATWRPSTGVWNIHMSTGRLDVMNYQWGWSGDVPVPADYDGDGLTDAATWRPSTAGWWIHFSSGRPDITGYSWGWSSDIPAPADYDHDGKADIGTWRPSTGGWWIDMSTAPNIMGYGWGWGTDVPAPADYDADGYIDIGTWRPSTGQWVVDKSHDADWNPGPAWGLSTDIPAIVTLNRRILQGLGLRPAG